MLFHLSFNGYTGTFSGKVGGFNSITFNDGAAATFDAAADISNNAWTFDLSARDAALSDDALLTWGGSFAATDQIAVTFADDAQAQAGWSIAAVAGVADTATFDLTIGGTAIGTVAYGQQIASGDYAGWGFELESGVLEFKNLA